jgi:hypothetical protein
MYMSDQKCLSAEQITNPPRSVLHHGPQCDGVRLAGRDDLGIIEQYLSHERSLPVHTDQVIVARQPVHIWVASTCTIMLHRCHVMVTFGDGQVHELRAMPQDDATSDIDDRGTVLTPGTVSASGTFTPLPVDFELGINPSMLVDCSDLQDHVELALHYQQTRFKDMLGDEDGIMFYQPGSSSDGDDGGSEVNKTEQGDNVVAKDMVDRGMDEGGTRKGVQDTQVRKRKAEAEEHVIHRQSKRSQAHTSEVKAQSVSEFREAIRSTLLMQLSRVKKLPRPKLKSM